MRYGLILLAVAALMMVAATAVPFIEQENIPPTPTAVCAPAPPSHLITHLRARVLTDDPRPLNLRDAPGTKGSVLTQIPTDSVLYVLEGPRCSQNYAWFRVEFHGMSGWIAEGDSSAYFVGVYPPGW